MLEPIPGVKRSEGVNSYILVCFPACTKNAVIADLLNHTAMFAKRNKEA